MKEITLYDLRVLVESLEDEKVPIVQSDHKTLVDDGVREIQENVKDLYKEIKENQKKIDEQKSVEEKALLEESVDETKTFIKWDNTEPSFVSGITGTEGPYNNSEINTILATNVWTSNDLS